MNPVLPLEDAGSHLALLDSDQCTKLQTNKNQEFHRLTFILPTSASVRNSCLLGHLVTKCRGGATPAIGCKRNSDVQKKFTPPRTKGRQIGENKKPQKTKGTFIKRPVFPVRKTRHFSESHRKRPVPTHGTPLKAPFDPDKHGKTYPAIQSPQFSRYTAARDHD